MTTRGHPNTGREPSWFTMASQFAVVRRSLSYAVIVGAILITINHADAILRGDISGGRLAKMGLTVIVPYLVSTLSSVGAMRTAARAHAAGTRGPGSSPNPRPGNEP